MYNQLLRHYQKEEQLSSNNKLYQALLDDLFLFLVRNDHIDEDVTTSTFLTGGMQAARRKGNITAKTQCVIAGIDEVMYLSGKHTKLIPHVFVPDGERILGGRGVVTLEGSVREILTYERTFLNILQRMSGIATETKLYIDTIHDTSIKHTPMVAATRKTPWMHVDKKAVAVGGGVTHRLDLQDGILLKDNHLEVVRQAMSLGTEDEAVAHAIRHAKIPDHEIVVGVEVRTDTAAFAAVHAWKEREAENPFVLLLDNFTPKRVKKVIEEIKESENKVFFEVSGGITLENVVKFAETGVDVISIGALTHSPKAADLSMDIL